MIGLDHIDSPTSIMKEDSPMEESWLKGSIDDETLAAIDRLYSNKPTKMPPRFEYGM